MVVEVGLAFVGKAAAGKAVGASLDTVVGALLQAQNRQLKLLESIHEDVHLMVEGPWQQARAQLEIARRVRGGKQREALEKAARALEEAVGNFRGSGREPAAASELSVVYRTLDERELSVAWAQQSFNAAEQYLDDTTRAAQQGIRTPLGAREALKRRLFQVTPPSIEWLWWKNDISSESQLAGLQRSAGAQGAFVPLRLRLRPALEAGVEIPPDRAGMAAVLHLPELNWLQFKTIAWTLELPEIQKLYHAHRMHRQLPDYAGLCRALGGTERAGQLDVDLSAQETAVVRYTRWRGGHLD